MWFFIWLIGWFVAYFLMSRATGHYIKNWESMDRICCSVCSLGSWVTVVVAVLILTFNSKYATTFLKKLEPKTDKYQKD